jgi:hypothetical protein
LNLLVFLNEGWSDADGGCLELWDREVRAPVQRIVPALNRCVIFATNSAAFHGVPSVSCAPGRSRKSLALYYFRDEDRALPIRSTHYVPRPNDRPITRVLIHVDRWLFLGSPTSQQHGQQAGSRHQGCDQQGTSRRHDVCLAGREALRFTAAEP